MPNEPPEMTALLRMMMDSRLDQVYTAIPGRIVSYDRVNTVANIQPQVKENGEAVPVLQNVPVCWPRGGGGYLVFDVNTDDCGLLIFSKTDIGLWRERGEIGDPGDLAAHSIANAVFFPGLYPNGHTVTHEAGACVLEATKIKLCKNAVDSVIKGDAYNTALSTYILALKAWVDAVTTALPSISGASNTFKLAADDYKDASKDAESDKVFTE